MGRRTYGVKRNDYEDDDGYYFNNNNNYMRFEKVRTNKPCGLVIHTDQSDYRFP
jgi:hypothetical protein